MGLSLIHLSINLSLYLPIYTVMFRDGSTRAKFFIELDGAYKCCDEFLLFGLIMHQCQYLSLTSFMPLAIEGKKSLLVSASEGILRFHPCCTHITIPEGIHILYISIFLYDKFNTHALSKGCFSECPFSTPWKVQQMLFCLILSVVKSQDLSNIQPSREKSFCAGLFDTFLVIWTLLDIGLQPNRDS